jgi:hypothetical protein
MQSIQKGSSTDRGSPFDSTTRSAGAGPQPRHGQTPDQVKKKDPSAAWVFFKIVRRGRGGAEFVAAIEPAQWYVLAHDLKSEVREGMLHSKPSVGMTRAELLLTMGKASSERNFADAPIGTSGVGRWPAISAAKTSICGIWPSERQRLRTPIH